MAASNGFRQPQMLVWSLLPVEEVEWLRVRNQETIDIWKAVEDLSATLEISAREIAGSATYLLNPNVIGGDGEWEARYYAHWLVLEETKTRVIEIQESNSPAEVILRQLEALAVEYRDKRRERTRTVFPGEGTQHGSH
jgi:hypothetical protein